MRGNRNVLLMLGAALVAGAVSAQSTPAAAPVKPQTPVADKVAKMEVMLEDWPQLGRYREANAALKPVEEGRVVFYGDSITDHWALDKSFFPGKPYVGRGISGQTTAQMVVRFRQDVVNLHPVAVVILAGVNDIAGNTGPSTLEMIEDNLRSMVEVAQANGIRVVMTSVLPAADFPWKPGQQPAPKIQALNAWIAAYCAEKHVTFVNYYPVMATSEGGMKDGLSYDGVHPTPAGYAVMAPMAQAGIDEALKSK